MVLHVVTVMPFFFFFFDMLLRRASEMREERGCRERMCVSGNGPCFKLELREAETGQLLIIFVSEGMIKKIVSLMHIL